MPDPPLDERAIEAAARAVLNTGARSGDYDALAPQSQAYWKATARAAVTAYLRALPVDELVERVARAEVVARYALKIDPGPATDEDREVAHAVLAALGLTSTEEPVAERDEEDR